MYNFYFRISVIYFIIRPIPLLTSTKYFNYIQSLESLKCIHKSNLTINRIGIIYISLSLLFKNIHIPHTIKTVRKIEIHKENILKIVIIIKLLKLEYK